MEWIDDSDDDADLKEVTRRYLPDTVIWTTDWTTGSLTEQLQRGVFNVDPPFQRRSAWTDRKASLYIESLLLGCPVPPITLAELSPSKNSDYQYIVIDGKQRLGSLKRFVVDNSLVLTGLDILPNLNRKTFSEVEMSTDFRRFANLPIRTIILRNWQKDEVLHFVFHRLNTQVTPLSTHELRRSLLGGPFTEFLDVRSAKSTGIQQILGIEEPDYRLRDAELLLRAISFIMFRNKYAGNLKSFLDSVTRTLNKNLRLPATRAEVSAVCDSIDDAIEATFAIFGDDAFQRVDGDGQFTGRFNRAIFDIMVYAFQFLDVRRAATAQPDQVIQAFIRLNGEQRFSRSVEATTKRADAVSGRVKDWLAALGTALGIEDLDKRVSDGDEASTV